MIGGHVETTAWKTSQKFYVLYQKLEHKATTLIAAYISRGIYKHYPSGRLRVHKSREKSREEMEYQLEAVNLLEQRSLQHYENRWTHQGFHYDHWMLVRVGKGLI